MEKPWLDYNSERRRHAEMLANNPRYVHDLGGVKFFDRVRPMGSADFGSADFGSADFGAAPGSITDYLPYLVYGFALWYFRKPIIAQLKKLSGHEAL